jgi:steroid 5-alpha reductase family enzyme
MNSNSTIAGPVEILDEYYFTFSALITIGLQLTCYAIAASCKFDLITDFAGSVNFVLLAVITLVLGNNFGTRGIAITTFVLITRLYLAFFLLFRVCTRKKDARFDEVRENCLAFLVFWIYQIFWVFLCMMPVIYTNSRGPLDNSAFATVHSDRTYVPIGGWDYLGWALFGIGIIIQVIADYQKYFFRKNPANKGTFMNQGIWKFSRHPNYFGEILIWWGAFICCVPIIPLINGSSGTIAAGFVTLLSPIFTMFILIFGTGVPQAEGKNLSRYYKAGNGDNWEKYANQTPPIVIFPNSLYACMPICMKTFCCCELSSYRYRKEQEALTDNPSA